MDLFDLADWLLECSKNVEKEIEHEVGKSAKLVQGQAKLLAPVDTGNLRNNINTSVEWRGNTCVGIVSADASYAPFIEYGTGIYSSLGTGRQTPWCYTPDGGNTFYWTQGQAPQPFMYPALLNCQDRIFNDLINMVGRFFK